jgi:chromosome partitioning protein
MANATLNDFWISTADLALAIGKSPKETVQEIENLCGPLSQKNLVPPKQARKLLSSKGFSYPQRTVSFQMLKGGVAKSTSALNFGLRAAMYGCKVLFVDMDQQANLTFALGVDSEELPVWLDIVEKKTSIEQAIVNIDENIDLIPSSLNNSVLDRVLLNSQRNWIKAVSDPLKEVRSFYDLVIIDTAPNLSATNTAVTSASDEVILPINPDKFSMLGLKKNLADLQDLKAEFGLSFQERILFTKFDARERLSHEIFKECSEKFEDLLIKSYIRTSSEIKNTIGTEKSIFARGKLDGKSSRSNAKQDYDQLTRELLNLSVSPTASS